MYPTIHTNTLGYVTRYTYTRCILIETYDTHKIRTRYNIIHVSRYNMSDTRQIQPDTIRRTDVYLGPSTAPERQGPAGAPPPHRWSQAEQLEGA